MGRSGARMGVVVDSGALIGFERRDRRIEILLIEEQTKGGRVFVPAGVVAQVWRNGRFQARVARLLRGRATEVVPFDEEAARAVGYMLGRAGTTDVVDASVVWCAHERGSPVLTSDPDDLRRLDPKVDLVAV
jgi:hypothetical protein